MSRDATPPGARTLGNNGAPTRNCRRAAERRTRRRRLGRRADQTQVRFGGGAGQKRRVVPARQGARLRRSVVEHARASRAGVTRAWPGSTACVRRSVAIDVGDEGIDRAERLVQRQRSIAASDSTRATPRPARTATARSASRPRDRAAVATRCRAASVVARCTRLPKSFARSACSALTKLAAREVAVLAERDRAQEVVAHRVRPELVGQRRRIDRVAGRLRDLLAVLGQPAVGEDPPRQRQARAPAAAPASTGSGSE